MEEGGAMNDKEMRDVTRCMLDVCRCLDTIRENQFAKFGLTRGQHSFLARIGENPGINQENLSFLLKVDRSTTAKALKKLQDKGYIQKKHPENNKKDWILFVTEEGRALWEEMEASVNGVFPDLYAGVSEKEFQLLDQILARMDQNAVKMYLGNKNGPPEQG